MYARRCDVVNGGKDQVATLLVPKHNYAETLLEYAKYKLRLNPMAQREARFREHITGFPDVIEDTISYLIIREPQSVRQTFSTYQL